jgi:hypothetical protein
MERVTMPEKRQQRYFSLKPSEMAVFEAASRIYAAYIASGAKNPENQDDLMRLSIEEAIQIGSAVEDAVQSDDELDNVG